MSGRSPCIKCELTDNSNGLYTCNGCRQSFCSNHIIDHTNELRTRFEQIINEYNLIIDIFNNYKQKSDDFQWKISEREKEINEIKLKINENQKLSKFNEINGPIQLLEDERVAEHNGPDYTLGSFRINQIYSKGIYSIQLLFEKFSSSNTFIGIIESTNKQSISSSYGWFIGDKYNIFQIIKKIWSFVIRNQSNHYAEDDVKQGDRIEIEINCINLTSTLTNKRTDKKYELNIDLKQSPLPWQIIINLDRYGDRVRLQLL